MHRHAFFRTARTTQVALTCGADIEHLADLARTYWAILSRPTYIEGRAETLASDLDTNEDGRIRMPEVLAAIEWLKPRIASFDRLFLPYEGLVKEDFRDDTPEGKALSDLLAQIAPDGTPVPLDTLFKQRTKVCGAEPCYPGKVPFTIGCDPTVERRVLDVAETLWCCNPGISGEEELGRKEFEEGVKTVDQGLAWIAAKPKSPYDDDAFSTFCALQKSIDAYFLACETLRYDPATPVLIHDPALPLDKAPLARPSAEANGLPLRDGINPKWRKALARVSEWVSSDVLTPEAWQRLKANFAPLTEWYDDPEFLPRRDDFLAFVDSDDKEQIEDLTNPEIRATLLRLIAESEAKISLSATYDELQRFASLRGGLLRFLRNFVNVSDLYPPVADPLFLCGKLFMDGRIASLCFPVANGGEKAHAALAAPARCCLVYCTLERKDEANRTILAVFTAGTVGALAVGKRGLFVDLKGNDWEATVSHVAITTISLWEAFFAPWRKIGEVCSETVQKLIGGRGDTATAVVTAAAVTKTQAAVGSPATTPAVPAAKATPPASNASQMASVATLGISLSFLASAAAAIASAVTHAPLWKTGSVVLGIILVVSIPSVILAWFRLRNRDLAPILNASGWAVNRAIGLTPRLGRFFTQRASYLGRRFVRRPNARKERI